MGVLVREYGCGAGSIRLSPSRKSVAPPGKPREDSSGPHGQERLPGMGQSIGIVGMIATAGERACCEKWPGARDPRARNTAWLLGPSHGVPWAGPGLRLGDLELRPSFVRWEERDA